MQKSENVLGTVEEGIEPEGDVEWDVGEYRIQLPPYVIINTKSNGSVTESAQVNREKISMNVEVLFLQDAIKRQSRPFVLQMARKFIGCGPLGL